MKNLEIDIDYLDTLDYDEILEYLLIIIRNRLEAGLDASGYTCPYCGQDLIELYQKSWSELEEISKQIPEDDCPCCGLPWR